MSVFRKLKTFKLRALHSQQKFGVAGKSCQEVLRKGCLHFQVRRGLGVGGPVPPLAGARKGPGQLRELVGRLWVGCNSLTRHLSPAALAEPRVPRS